MVGYTEIIDIPVEGTEKKAYPSMMGILFMSCYQPGMVGEEYEWYEAYQVSYEHPVPYISPEPVDYMALKSIYKRLEGKERRIKFWGWMIHYSPEAEKRRSDEVDMEIQSIIR